MIIPWMGNRLRKTSFETGATTGSFVWEDGRGSVPHHLSSGFHNHNWPSFQPTSLDNPPHPPPQHHHRAAFYWAAIESKRVRDVFVKWTGIVIVTWFSNCCRSCIMYLQINRWILLLQKNCFIYLCETGGKGNTTIILPVNNKRYSMILDNTKWYLTCRLISATSSIMRLPSRRIT